MVDRELATRYKSLLYFHDNCSNDHCCAVIICLVVRILNDDDRVPGNQLSLPSIHSATLRNGRHIVLIGTSKSLEILTRAPLICKRLFRLHNSMPQRPFYKCSSFHACDILLVFIQSISYPSLVYSPKKECSMPSLSVQNCRVIHP